MSRASTPRECGGFGHDNGTTSGSVFGSAAVTVTNAAPTVATPDSATPGTVTGTTTALSVLGSDDVAARPT